MIGPTVIIGMHRSGTTAIARALQDLGLHIGRDLDGNAESRVFQRANVQLFCLAGARWDLPEPVETLLQDEEKLQVLAQSARSYLGQRSVAKRYLGRKASLFHRDLLKLEFPWGWKDPRTTFTFPLWSRVFPEVQLIHVKRHGIDVAASLMHRKKTMLAAAMDGAMRKPDTFWNREKCPDGMQWFEDIERGLRLWQTYERAANWCMASVKDNSSISVRFEDLLEDPKTELSKLALFCGITPAPQKLSSAVHLLDSTRRYAFLASPTLVAAAKSATSMLEEYGYGDPTI